MKNYTDLKETLRVIIGNAAAILLVNSVQNGCHQMTIQRQNSTNTGFEVELWCEVVVAESHQ